MIRLGIQPGCAEPAGNFWNVRPQLKRTPHTRSDPLRSFEIGRRVQETHVSSANGGMRREREVALERLEAQDGQDPFLRGAASNMQNQRRLLHSCSLSQDPVI